MVLKSAAMAVADTLELSSDLVRANLFGRADTRCLRMIRELTFQMTHEPEYTIELPVGYGSTGRCFKTGQDNIALLENDWGPDFIEDEQLQKVQPELKWIISVPVLGPGDPPEPIWVLNIDGLKEKREAESLGGALSEMYKYSNLISLMIPQA